MKEDTQALALMSAVSKCLQIKWADSNSLGLIDDDRQQNVRKKRRTSDGQTDSEKLLESFLHFHALETKWLFDQGARESYYACDRVAGSLMGLCPIVSKNLQQLFNIPVNYNKEM